MKEIRREIYELVAMYELHPQLVDVYVEGRSDRIFLEYLLDGLNARVIEIDDINVPTEVVSRVGLQPGNRAEVIALAAELDMALPRTHEFSQRCIIDADFDRLFENSLYLSRFLRWTDYSCLESYWFDDYHLSKYNKFGLREPKGLQDVDIASTLGSVLRILFVIRAAVQAIGDQWHWLDPSSCLSVTGTDISFDEAGYIVKLLNKNAAFAQRDDLVAKRDELFAKLERDHRHSMHGHDFIGLLSWYVRQYVNDNRLTHGEVVARMLACCCNRKKMQEHPLIAELLTLAGAA